jgi:opacity protein-like surface antigen
LVAAVLLSTPAFAATVVDTSESAPVVTSGSVFAGGGFGDFSTGQANVSVGAGWEARIGVVLLRYLGFEASYQGMSSDVTSVKSGAFVPAGTQVLLTEVSADFVPGIPIPIGRTELRPYGVVGVGYGGVSSNLPTLSLLGTRQINAVAVPVGVGLSYRLTKVFMLDTRFTYSFLSEQPGNNWTLGFNLGAAFGPE